MTDAELATFIGLSGVAPSERAKIMASITPAQRATYDDMAKTEHEVALYQAGLGPKPAGVIICGCRGGRPGHVRCRATR